VKLKPDMIEAFNRIEDERDRQDAKWGEQNLSDDRWMIALVEEVGELAEAILANGKPRNLDNELTQVAAVAVAWM